jgi:hypothetical protein
MAETEAQGVRFTIDHYEPESARPDLANDYLNLMYCCDECNTRKGDRTPTQGARAAGYRFYRPDQDVFFDHFDINGMRLTPNSNSGEYSIEAIDLNRQSLRRIRQLRDRLFSAAEHVAAGIEGLRHFKIDQLPQEIKGRARSAISKAAVQATQLCDDIDATLKAYASSPLLDVPEDDGDRLSQRERKLRALEVMYPGKWRGRAIKKKPA